jgi:hypothetical protein
MSRIEPNSRVSDVLHTLADPIEYVRGIVGSFVTHRFDRATSIVRIGVSGRGIVPNYSIETPCVLDPAARIKTYVSKRHVFNGRNHEEFLDDCPIGERWSSEGMSFSEVQMLLGQLRETKKRH